ncbi:MAG TPA: response regulator [Ktedonobacterales bacterium]|nr:response regulator [Ktedonobacterales bacterium]
MRRYCPCGAPIWVTAHWTGQEIVLVLYDGLLAVQRGAEPLRICPRCHRALVLSELTWLPEPSQPEVHQRQRSILIVEDEDDLRLLLAELLADAGFQVRTARDGQEALARLQQERSWVVLLDWMLPRLNGRQVLALLEADPLLRADTKVIVMSAGWRLEQERQLLESEVVAARLPKPFDPETLLDLARHLADPAA